MSRPLFTVKGGSFEATKPSREVSDWINEWLVPVTEPLLSREEAANDYDIYLDALAIWGDRQ